MLPQKAFGHHPLTFRCPSSAEASSSFYPDMSQESSRSPSRARPAPASHRAPSGRYDLAVSKQIATPAPCRWSMPHTATRVICSRPANGGLFVMVCYDSVCVLSPTGLEPASPACLKRIKSGKRVNQWRNCAILLPYVLVISQHMPPRSDYRSVLPLKLWRVGHFRCHTASSLDQWDCRRVGSMTQTPR